jgi:hypothetical protein
MLNFSPGDKAMCKTAGGKIRIVIVQAVNKRHILADNVQYRRDTGAIVTRGVQLVEETLCEIDEAEITRIQDSELRQALVESIHEACAAHKLRMLSTEQLTKIYNAIGGEDDAGL